MKKINWVFNIAIVLSGLSLVACGGGGGGGTPTGTTTPATVSSTSPANGSTGVLTNATLSVTFNVDMDAASINTSNFTLTGLNPVSGTISYNATTRTATFTPDAPLKHSQVFTAKLTTSITDAAGKALSAVYQQRFSTETFIRRVSVDSSNAEANGNNFQPDVSADGRYVVFKSLSNNLLGNNDTNSRDDIFLHDTQTGKTTRVSISTAGVEANGDSSEPVISANGRYVAFHSDASNLIDGITDGNDRLDVFVHDTQTGATTLVSVDNSGTGAPGQSTSTFPSISADGRYIAFSSSASNLVVDDNNSSTDVFIRDTQAATTTLVSVNSSEAQASGNSQQPHISGNGRYVAFESVAALEANDTNAISDVYVRDTQNGDTIRVSVSNTVGVEPDRGSSSPSISADGRYVAFASTATNLLTTGTDSNGEMDVFIRDTQGSTTTLVSIKNGSSTGIDGASFAPAISADGRYVAFQSDATNLLATDDNNNWADVFVRDTQDNTTIRVNVDKNGVAYTGTGFAATVDIAISANGRYVVFSSSIASLIPLDGNGADDIFRVLNTTP